MHYFKFNIGDYHKKAGRLSMLQHGAYTLLIHACYDREKFLQKKRLLTGAGLVRQKKSPPLSSY